MTRNLRSQRRPHYDDFICTVVSALLLLSSLSILHNHYHDRFPSHEVNYDPHLLSDLLNYDTSGGEDTINALYMVEEQTTHESTTDKKEDENPLYDNDEVSSYFFDHVEGVIRKPFPPIEEWDVVVSAKEDRVKIAFGSDDMPVDEWVRTKMMEVKCIEDALLLKGSLREGWGDWFDMKSDFFRKDKMLRSNLEALNPLNNPMLQDPDTPGLTILTKGDKLWQMSMLNEFKQIPFPLKNIISEPKLP